jgi:hypothetical protein
MEELLVFMAEARSPYSVKERSKGNFKNDPNDITKQWNDLLKEMSYGYDDDLMIERSCKEALVLVFTAGEKGEEPYQLKERTKGNVKNDRNDITKQWNDLLKEMSYKYDVSMHSKECTVNSIAEEEEMSKNMSEADGEHSEKQGKQGSLNEAVNMDVEETGSVSNAVNLGTMLQEKENMIEVLKAKLVESQTTFKDLKEEMAVYKTKSNQ